MCETCVQLGRGILPAVSGQFVSHGLRTFAYEGSLNIMKAVTGGAAELQVICLHACGPLISSGAWMHAPSLSFSEHRLWIYYLSICSASEEF